MFNWVQNPNSSTWGLQEQGQDPAAPHVPQASPSLMSWLLGTCCVVLFISSQLLFPDLPCPSFFEIHLLLSDLSGTVSPLLSLLLGEFNLLALQLFLCLLLDMLSHQAPYDL